MANSILGLFRLWLRSYLLSCLSATIIRTVTLAVWVAEAWFKSIIVEIQPSLPSLYLNSVSHINSHIRIIYLFDYVRTNPWEDRFVSSTFAYDRITQPHFRSDGK